MIPQNFSFIASPENRAQHADKVAAGRAPIPAWRVIHAPVTSMDGHSSLLGPSQLPRRFGVGGFSEVTG